MKITEGIKLLELLKDRMTNYTVEQSTMFRNKYPYVDPNSLATEHDFSVFDMPPAPFGFSLWLNIYHNRGVQPYPILEKFGDSYLMYTSRTGVYFDTTNDKIYKLSCTQLPNDWEMHNRLYELTQGTRVKIETPLHGEPLTINGIDFWYTIVQRDKLITLTDPHQIHKEDRLDKTFLFNFIDLTTEKCLLVKQLYDKYQIGCPAAGAVMNKFVVSPNEPFNGIFTDLKHWKFTFDEYMSYNYASIYHYLDDHRNHNLIPHNEVRVILNHALNQFSKTSVPEHVIKEIENPTNNIEMCNQHEKALTIYE